MRNAECGIDIPASSLELSFSFRIPNSTLRISPEADRMLLFLTVTSLALQAPVADTSPFRALPLPAPNRVRGASGAPGPDYWQQHVDYVIRATLDTAGSVLRGSALRGRPDGTDRHAPVRDRPMVPAPGGVRRHARVESAALHRRRGVLSRIR